MATFLESGPVTSPDPSRVGGSPARRSSRPECPERFQLQGPKVCKNNDTANEKDKAPNKALLREQLMVITPPKTNMSPKKGRFQ